MGRVQGKVAFITGAARGQGRAHAVMLAREGADIIATDLCADLGWTTYRGSTEADLAETVRQVEAVGGRILASRADVRDPAALSAAADAGVERFGKIDTVVANAGVGRMDRWEDTTDEVWQSTIDINLTGVWNTVKATAGHVIAAGGGSMILVSSAGGLKAMPFMPPYIASKFGVTGLAKALAQELANRNVRVNSLHPTGVATPMAEGENDAAALFADQPRLGPILQNLLPVEITQPEDPAYAVLYLASDESRFVTATAFAVDAGISNA